MGKSAPLRSPLNRKSESKVRPACGCLSRSIKYSVRFEGKTRHITHTCSARHIRKPFHDEPHYSRWQMAATVKRPGYPAMPGRLFFSAMYAAMPATASFG